jgi:hypothetical protein
MVHEPILLWNSDKPDKLKFSFLKSAYNLPETKEQYIQSLVGETAAKNQPKTKPPNFLERKGGFFFFTGRGEGGGEGSLVFEA